LQQGVCILKFINCYTYFFLVELPTFQEVG
jgi:hypothetical protein